MFAVQLVQHLLGEMERLCGKAIAMHYNSSVKYIDTVAQTVQLDTADGLQTFQYDLLLGADGYHSAVRTALEQQASH